MTVFFVCIGITTISLIIALWKILQSVINIFQKLNNIFLNCLYI